MAYGNFCGSTGLFTLPTPPGSKPAGNKPAAPERPRGSPGLVEPELEIGRGGGSARATGVANPLGRQAEKVEGRPSGCLLEGREERGQVILTAPKASDLEMRQGSLPHWAIADARVKHE